MANATPPLPVPDSRLSASTISFAIGNQRAIMDAFAIVINLEHVNYVDSAGLGALIEMQRKTKAKGGSLKLCHLRPNLTRALEMARLLPIFETCPTETAAVASF